MTDMALKKHYAELTPEERFRLIYAAGAREDSVEQERLAQSAEKIGLSMPDYAPASHAFSELSLLIYIELLDQAALYADAMRIDAQQSRDRWDEEQDERRKRRKQIRNSSEGNDDKRSDGIRPETKDLKAADWKNALKSDRRAERRTEELVLACGCVFREKVRGWELFCELLKVPPFTLWRGLPGFERFQRYLGLSETLAFTRKGLLRWLNRTRDKDHEKAKTCISGKRIAKATEEMFRDRVKWWGGD